jgi:hypothetical protein
MKIFLVPLFCLSAVCFSFRETRTAENKHSKLPIEGLRQSPADPYAVLDDYAKKAPRANEKNMATLAGYLLKAGPKNDQEKARLLYTWIVTHIRYDMAAYNSGKITDCSAELVLAKKTTVCEGYSNLFKKLGEAMGLEVVSIVGYDKGNNYKEGSKLKKAEHAWNAIKVDGKWQLFDPTWGGGSIVAGNGGEKNYVFKFDPYWFNVNPKEFIFYHLPEEGQWQLLDAPITLKQFEKLPFAYVGLFKLGFSADSLFNGVMDGSIKKLPESFSLKYPVTVLEAPYNGILRKGQKYNFVVLCKGPEVFALMDGDKLYPFTREGDRFHIEHVPQSSSLQVLYKLKEKDEEGSGILKYQVK